MSVCVCVHVCVCVCVCMCVRVCARVCEHPPLRMAESSAAPTGTEDTNEVVAAANAPAG